MLNTHAADFDLALLTDIEFVDMEPLDAVCDLVGVAPHVAVALVPEGPDHRPSPFSAPAPLAPEDLPTEEYASFQ